MASAMRSSRLAWALCGFAVVVTLLVWTLRLLIAGASHDVPADLEAGAGDIVWPLAVLGFAFVGALVASRQPDNPIGWIFCGGAVAFSLSGLGEAYAVYTLFANPGGLLGGGETMAWFSVWVWVLGGVPLLILFPLLFPNGKLLSPRWRFIAGLALAAIVFLTVGTAFAPGPLEDLSEIDNPYGAGRGGRRLNGFQGLGWLLLIICLIAAATSLVLRFRRAHGVERLQLKWVAAASVVLVASFLSWEVWEGMAPLGILAMVVAAGIAILRYRLYDIDVVINRTLVYGALTATLARAYLGSVLLLQLALRPLTESSNLAIAGSTLGVAALFRPARARIQDDGRPPLLPAQVRRCPDARAFWTAMRDEVDLDALGNDLRAVVAETMQPAHVSLWLKAPEATADEPRGVCVVLGPRRPLAARCSWPANTPPPTGQPSTARPACRSWSPRSRSPPSAQWSRRACLVTRSAGSSVSPELPWAWRTSATVRGTDALRLVRPAARRQDRCVASGARPCAELRAARPCSAALSRRPLPLSADGGSRSGSPWPESA